MIKLFKNNPQQYRGDLVVYLVSQATRRAPQCDDSDVQHQINLAHKAGDFTGKSGQTLLIYHDDRQKKTYKRILVVGLGKEKLTREELREAGGTIAKSTLATKAKKILVVLPKSGNITPAETAECLTEGLLLGKYRFLKYKGVKEEDGEAPHEIQEIALFSAEPKEAEKGTRLGRVAAQAACRCRDMANEPGNQWTADHFVEYARQLAKQFGFHSEILSKNQLKKKGLNGILAVNQGSAVPPSLITLSALTGKKVPKLMLVGKGLTFDSGGLSLKPGEGMHEMKYDMCGGAAIMALMEGLGEAPCSNLDVIAMIPTTDNLIGPEAVKPGDIISMYGGKTVEVVNTDAEGRLILADALAYGVEKHQPDMVIDMATLTGAVIIGLGHHHTGLMANNDRLAQRLIKAGQRSGEPLWRLPLGKEYTKQLKSEVADLKNIGGKAGGSITAAAFLQEFVGKTKWAHLDIAGTAWNFTEKSYIPKGPSGIGVRTLLEFIRGWK